MKNTEITELDTFTDEVDVQLDMLGSLVVHRVRGHVDGGDIVTVCKVALEMTQRSSPRSWHNQMHLAAALATVRYSASALEREIVSCRLEDHDTRRRTRMWIALYPQEDVEPEHGLPCIWAARPVGVGVCGDRELR